MSATQTQTPAVCRLPAPCQFTMPCPLCGSGEASIAVNLACLEEANAFQCHECDGEFSIEDVQTFIRKWSRLLPWLCSVPAMDDDDSDSDE